MPGFVANNGRYGRQQQPPMPPPRYGQRMPPPGISNGRIAASQGAIEQRGGGGYAPPNSGMSIQGGMLDPRGASAPQQPSARESRPSANGGGSNGMAGGYGPLSGAADDRVYMAGGGPQPVQKNEQGPDQGIDSGYGNYQNYGGGNGEGGGGATGANGGAAPAPAPATYSNTPPSNQFSTNNNYPSYANPFGGSPDLRPAVYQGEDIAKQINNVGLRNEGKGDQLANDIQNKQNFDQGQYLKYNQQADAAYAPFANGGGGYTDAEKKDIMGTEGLNNQFLTEDEKAGMTGNPDKQRGWYDPASLDAINNEGQKNLSGAYNTSADKIRSTVDPSKLSLSSRYNGDVQDTLNSRDSSANDILGNSDANVRGAVTGDLRQNSAAANEIKLTPQQQQDMVTAAGMDVGYKNKSDAQRIMRKANNAGYNSPMALAAGLHDIQTEGDANAGDAMFRARIGANSEAARRNMALEENRQGAERTYADMKSGSEMALGNRSLADMRNAERTRLDANKDTENMRLNAEQGSSDRQRNVEQGLGQDAMNVAKSNTNLAMGTQKYNQEAGMKMEQDIDNTKTNRAAGLATNRQGQNQYVNNATSSRATGVANAKRADQGEYRNYTVGQQSQANSNVNNANDQKIKNYQVQSGAANTNAATAAGYDTARQSGGFWNSFQNAAGQSLGNINFKQNNPPGGNSGGGGINVTLGGSGGGGGGSYDGWGGV